MCRISDTRSCATTVFGCLSESCVGSLAPEGHNAALYDHDSSTANCAAQWGGVAGCVCSTSVSSGCRGV